MASEQTAVPEILSKRGINGSKSASEYHRTEFSFITSSGKRSLTEANANQRQISVRKNASVVESVEKIRRAR